MDEIFTYLQQADCQCLVAIDEFQQITKYGDPNIEAEIRTHVQYCYTIQTVFLQTNILFFAPLILYGLTSPNSVKSAIPVLLDKGLLTYDKGIYKVSDEGYKALEEFESTMIALKKGGSR